MIALACLASSKVFTGELAAVRQMRVNPGSWCRDHLLNSRGVVIVKAAGAETAGHQGTLPSEETSIDPSRGACACIYSGGDVPPRHAVLYDDVRDHRDAAVHVNWGEDSAIGIIRRCRPSRR